jgi:hypothetical protein|uniref:Uncharacterized protein n=1 Tax=Picea glauca TaxID=3330 RepID=A0A101LW96_PICGL|nr:hypothetical protein ABT39_MTgene1587 [Picea glauca]
MLLGLLPLMLLLVDKLSQLILSRRGKLQLLLKLLDIDQIFIVLKLRVLLQLMVIKLYPRVMDLELNLMSLHLDLRALLLQQLHQGLDQRLDRDLVFFLRKETKGVLVLYSSLS